MRFSTTLVSAFALAAAIVAAPALAQDAPLAAPNNAPEATSPDTAGPTAPPSAFTITGGATLVSDYRFRGISQTAKKVAIQGTFTVSHESGFYATVWGSSIDDYIANGGDAEVDLIAGYKKTIDGTTFDGGVLYYYYPGSGGANTDFFEPYISVAHTLGPVTGKITANYGFKQHALYAGRVDHPREDNLYLAGDLSAGVPNTPISLSAHLGHSFGPSYLTIGKEYTDWNLGASYVWKNFTLGVSYVDTNKSLFVLDNSGNFENVSKAGVVVSIGAAF